MEFKKYFLKLLSKYFIKNEYMWIYKSNYF